MAREVASLIACVQPRLDPHGGHASPSSFRAAFGTAMGMRAPAAWAQGKMEGDRDERRNYDRDHDGERNRDNDRDRRGGIERMASRLLR